MKILLILFFAISNTFANINSYKEQSTREGSTEVSMGFGMSQQSKYEGKNTGRVNLDPGLALRIDAGYHFNPHIYIGGVFSMNMVDYSADAVDDNGDDINYDSSLGFGSLEFLTKYTFFNTALSPYVEGSLGFSQIDSGVPSGEVVADCWWDPYHNEYVCGDRYPNKMKTVLSYSAGAGINYEMSRSFLLNAGVNCRYYVYHKTENFPFQLTYSVSFGYLFK